MKVWNKLVTLFDKGTISLAVFAAVLMAFVTLIVTGDVIGRSFFNNPIQNTQELSGHAMLWITFLGLAWVLKKGGHVKMDFVYYMLGQKTRAVLDIWATALLILTIGTLVVASASLTYGYWVDKTIFFTIASFPRAPIIAIMPIASLFLLFECIRQHNSAWRKWKSLRSNSTEAQQGDAALIGREL